MSLDLNHQKFLAAFEVYKIELESFKGGKKVAAARARKQLSIMSKLAKELRANISEKKNKMGGAKKKSKKKSKKK